MENYFNYFTEIEEHFQRRRGGILLLSTLDWALIETWKDAGVPLAAVLRGIDESFDKYDRRKLKARKVNSLAYCSQEVLSAAENMKEALAGVHAGAADQSSRPDRESGFEPVPVAAYLKRNADLLARSSSPENAATIVHEAEASLKSLAREVLDGKFRSMEDVERHLTVLEEKLYAALLMNTPDNVLVELRGEADRAVSPYRSKMQGAQLEQLMKQYLNKRLLERYNLPRLSLFYM